MSWNFVPFIYLQGAEGESSETSCSDTIRSELSKSKSIPEELCCNGSLTDAYLDSLFGTTLQRSGQTTKKQSHLSSGSERYHRNSPFVAGSHSHAKMSVPPAKERESLENDPDFGKRWRELSVKYDLDSHSWKTHRCLFSEDLEWSSVTFPRWGMIRLGVLYQRKTAGRPMSGIGCGSFPTPIASDGTNAQGPNGRHKGLGTMAKHELWPTPTVCGNHNKKGYNKNSGDGLATAVTMWPTPCAMEPQKNLERYAETLSKSRSERGGGKGPNLATAVTMWPTPRAQKMTDEDEVTWRKRKDAGKVSTPPLALVAKMYPLPPKKWPTPQATFLAPPTDEAIRRRMEDGRQNGVPLSEEVAREALEDKKQNNRNVRLNPDWVELLMGWACGWTSKSPIDRDDFLSWISGNTTNGWVDGSWEVGMERAVVPNKETTKRLKSIGNGQVPHAAAMAFTILSAEWLTNAEQSSK